MLEGSADREKQSMYQFGNKAGGPRRSVALSVGLPASKCCVPRNSRIKIEPELHLIRHTVVQGCVEGRRSRLHWVLRFIFTPQELSLMAPILGDLGIVFVKFDPDKITPEFQSDLYGAATTAKWIENYATTDCWQIGFPPCRHRVSGEVLPSGILTTCGQAR